MFLGLNVNKQQCLWWPGTRTTNSKTAHTAHQC